MTVKELDKAKAGLDLPENAEVYFELPGGKLVRIMGARAAYVTASTTSTRRTESVNFKPEERSLVLR
jgi:hypothetical protein